MAISDYKKQNKGEISFTAGTEFVRLFLTLFLAASFLSFSLFFPFFEGDVAEVLPVSLPFARFEVVEKSENGWWFVSAEGGLESGWVPATYLDSADDQNEKVEPTRLEKNNKFIATQKFGATSDDEVGFDKNAVVIVTEKRLDGWWKVEYDGKSGWVRQLRHRFRLYLTLLRSMPPHTRRPDQPVTQLGTSLVPVRLKHA